MRIGLISDSHGSRDAIRKALNAMGPIDLLVHLGDGCDYDLSDCPMVRIWKLKGNCDWDTELMREIIEPLEGGVIGMFCHGDRWGVKMGLDRLVYHALDKGVHVACFGHTHQQYAAYENGILLINPGSCRGMDAGCAVLDISRDGTIHHELISMV